MKSFFSYHFGSGYSSCHGNTSLLYVLVRPVGGVGSEDTGELNVITGKDTKLARSLDTGHTLSAGLYVCIVQCCVCVCVCVCVLVAILRTCICVGTNFARAHCSKDLLE